MSDDKKKIGSLLPSRFNAAEFHRIIYHAKAEPGTKISDIEDSEYWAHVCATLNQFDHIEVVETSGAWWAELIVLSASKKDTNESSQERPTVRVRVALLASKEFAKPTELQVADSIDNYESQFTEGNKWHVLRKHDNHIMVKGMDSELDADDWIIENIGKSSEDKKAA